MGFEFCIVAAAYPKGSYLEGILGVNNQESGFGNGNLVVVKRCFLFFSTNEPPGPAMRLPLVVTWMLS